MKVLYVTASCLTKNTSANMSHNGYVQGLLENGCDLDILMANDSWGEQDKALPEWKQANYYIYDAVSAKERFRRRFTKANAAPVSGCSKCESGEARQKKISVRALVKKIFYILFPNDPVYPLHKTWLKNAQKFRMNEEYDLVISNSSPAASHALVMQLLQKKHISCKRWIQIWEDPWYYDIYGGGSAAICEEEHRLLRGASEIYYVSPLTLMYQKQYFSDCAEKMKYIPLPAFSYEEEIQKGDDPVSFGYFGDYYRTTRNLEPFYQAMVAQKATGYIYGDSDLQLASTDTLTVHGRTTLDKLSKIQGETDILVHLCNLKGGQIPGKIYHYSLTKKPILFILDGTEKEIGQIKAFFGKYNRYVFCENTIEAISNVITNLSDRSKLESLQPVDAFRPKEIVKTLFKHADQLF